MSRRAIYVLLLFSLDNNSPFFRESIYCANPHSNTPIMEGLENGVSNTAQIPCRVCALKCWLYWMTFMMVFIQLIITCIDKLAPNDVYHIIRSIMDLKNHSSTPDGLDQNSTGGAG
jgi:hypothetical protein